MASAYFSIVSDLGTKKMLEAINEEKKVNIVDFAVGDGGGSTYTPETTMTELKNEVWRGKTNACYISEDSENVLIVEAVIPSSVGGFTIREMGIFDEDNTLIAICNTPDTQKVKVSDGVVHELDLKMEIALSNVDSIELVVDPDVVMATKRDVEKVKNMVNRFTRTAVLAAGQTSVTFDLEGVQEDSVFRLFAEDMQLDYEAIDIDEENNQVTVFFEAQKRDATIKMVVSDGTA